MTTQDKHNEARKKAIEETIETIINTPLVKPYWKSLTITGNLGLAAVVITIALMPQFRPLIDSLAEYHPGLPIALVTVLAAVLNVIQRVRTDSAVGTSSTVARSEYINESRKKEALRKL